MSQHRYERSLHEPTIPDASETYGVPPAPPVPVRKRAPENAIVPQQDGTMAFKRAKLNKTNLELADDMTIEEWQEVGQHLLTFHEASRWWLADWVIRGGTKYGQTYESLSAFTGKEIKTLQNWVSVANRVEYSRRRESLSFSHHELVASLTPEDQDDWLSRAEAEGWSLSQMRTAMRPPTLSSAYEQSGEYFRKVAKLLPGMTESERREIADMARWIIEQIG